MHVALRSRHVFAMLLLPALAFALPAHAADVAARNAGRARGRRRHRDGPRRRRDGERRPERAGPHARRNLRDGGRQAASARLLHPGRSGPAPRPGPRDRLAGLHPRDDGGGRRPLRAAPVPRVLRRRAPPAVRPQARHRRASRFRHPALPVGQHGDPVVQHLVARHHAVHELQGDPSRRPLAPREGRPAGALLGVAVPPGRESRAAFAGFVPRLHHPELQRADQKPREGHARRAQARVRGPRGALRQARGVLGLERDRAPARADVRGGPRLDAPAASSTTRSPRSSAPSSPRRTGRASPCTRSTRAASRPTWTPRSPCPRP